MTGQAQTAAMTQSQFKTGLCARVAILFDCANGIYIDVQSYSSFSSLNLADPIDAGRNFVPPNNFSPGGPGDIVVVRVFYKWPLFVTSMVEGARRLQGPDRRLGRQEVRQLQHQDQQVRWRLTQAWLN